MKSLYEGTSRAKARLVMTDAASRVRARLTERKTSMRGLSNVRYWLEDAAPKAPRYDAGKRGDNRY